MNSLAGKFAPTLDPMMGHVSAEIGHLHQPFPDFGPLL
jgi:hypothetical protein